MGQANVSQLTPAMKERLTKAMGPLYDIQDALCAWIPQGDAVPVSDRAMRVDLKVGPGGVTGGVDLDGGSFSAGTGNLHKVATLQTVGLQHARQITAKAIYATDSEEKAVVNGWKDELRDAMIEYKHLLDQFIQGDETGVLATLVSNVSGSTYLCHDITTPSNTPYGTALLRAGNKYDIYDAATLATKRTGSPYAITQDGGLSLPGVCKVTFDSAITGYVANDKVVILNMVNAALFGLGYHVNDATSGTWQALSRALPYVQATSYDASNQPLDLNFIRVCLNLIRRRKGESQTKKLTPYTAPEQEHAYEQLGIAISEIHKGAGNEEIDLLFGDARMAGRKLMINTHADPTRIQFLEKSQFGWASMKKVGFFEADKQTVFAIIDTSTGVPKSIL